MSPLSLSLSLFRYRNPAERIANAGPVEITCGVRQLVGCDFKGCVTQITLADVGLQVSGNMEKMAPFPDLKVLDIDGYCEAQMSIGGVCTGIFQGDIEPFVEGVNKDLDYLSMRGTFLSGDGSVLTSLPSLTHLDLYGNMEVEGDLNPFLGGATGLQYLNLMSTCTKVNTKSLGNLKELIFLNLHSWGGQIGYKGCKNWMTPMAQGPLSDISGLSKLQYLDLTNWKSEGTMSDFSKMENLQALYAGNFDGSLKITGSLSDISNLKNLETLLLSKLDISINMDELSDFPKLTSLTIFDVSQVSGDVSEVCSLESMNNLQLTGVQGASCGQVPCLDTCGITS